MGSGDRYIADLLTKNQTPTILGLNKADQQPEDREPIDDSYRTLAAENNWSLLKFSALEGTGIEELQNLLIDSLEVGPYYYPPDLVTDQPERFIMGELIREQILLQTRQEIPHSVAVVIERVEETPALTKVFAAINVERDSQKGRVEEKLHQLETLGKQLIEKESDLAKVKKQYTVYKELAIAFGKNGLQTLMIENILPELEAQTNHILARLTGNQWEYKKLLFLQYLKFALGVRILTR